MEANFVWSIHYKLQLKINNFQTNKLFNLGRQYQNAINNWIIMRIVKLIEHIIIDCAWVFFQPAYGTIQYTFYLLLFVGWLELGGIYDGVIFYWCYVELMTRNLCHFFAEVKSAEITPCIDLVSTATIKSNKQGQHKSSAKWISNVIKAFVII